MTEYLSKKISIVSFILMIMIVILHAQLIPLSSGISETIQLIISGQVTRIAVPLFFLISGLLFFRNICGHIFQSCRCKIKKRFRTIFIPYLIFSILGFIFIYCTIILFPGYISGANAINMGISSIKDVLYTILLNPIGTYQLWFLRDLFIITIASPLIYYVLKYCKWIIIICLLGLWMTDMKFFISIEAITFFSIGSYIALYKQTIANYIVKNKIIVYAATSIWISICSLTVLCELDYIWHCIGILSGIIALWTLYDLIYPKLNSRILNSHIYSFSFFIYLVHEPLLTVIKKLVYIIFNSHYTLIIYIIAPILCSTICIILGTTIKSITPKFYYILTGGR